MSVPPVQGGAGKWVDDAKILQGLTPPGLCHCPKGGKIPTVSGLWNASRPTIPRTNSHKGVPGGDGETPSPSERHGSTIDTCLAPAIHDAWGCVGES